jgi:hypothetical protein
VIRTLAMKSGIHVRCRRERKAARHSKKVETLFSQFFADVQIKIIRPPQHQYRSKNQRPTSITSWLCMSAWGGLLGGSGHPQWLPSVNADGSVAGCSPQFWVAQLRSQISRSCNLLLTHWICAGTLALNERPGKALSHNVQTDSQNANAHLPAQIPHPKRLG